MSNRETLYYPYHDQVIMVVDFQPWRLGLGLTGRKLASNGLVAEYTYPRTAHDTKSLDIIANGDVCNVQLEHKFDHIPFLSLGARLIKKVSEYDRCQLFFSFEEQTPELLALVYEISHSVEFRGNA